MKASHMVLGIAIVIWTLAVILVPAARAADTGASAETPESMIDVTGITISPEVFMRGDTGTVTIEIQNTGESAVTIHRAKLMTPSGVSIANDMVYDAVGTIGPGHSMSFTYTVKATASDGIYYPEFYLDFLTGGSLRQYFPVKIDSTGIQVSVLDAPDTYAADSKETISLSLGNPRETSVNGVTVTLLGEHIRASQTAVFLGTLRPDAEKNATFEITPSESTELTFNVSYRNGMNDHFTTLALPVTVGGRSMAAELVVNNVEVAQGSGAITVTGDVTNAGLEEAYSVKVTVGTPAVPVDPYPVDVIGALEPDDFSSFELTFRAQGASTVPLVVEYRDGEGTILQETVTISLTGGTGQASAASPSVSGGTAADGRTNRAGMFGSFGTGFGRIPFLQMALVLVVAVVGVVAWRKGYFGKIRDRFRGRSRK